MINFRLTFNKSLQIDMPPFRGGVWFSSLYSLGFSPDLNLLCLLFLTLQIFSLGDIMKHVNGHLKASF